MLQDPERKIARPRQVYTGRDARDFVPIEMRGQREVVGV
jgi:citrate synthase